MSSSEAEPVAINLMSVRSVEVAKLNIPVVTESLIFTSIIGKIEDSAVTILFFSLGKGLSTDCFQDLS